MLNGLALRNGFGAASTNSSELTYASQQLGCSSGKAEKVDCLDQADY
jgi:hypothetical protein